MGLESCAGGGEPFGEAKELFGSSRQGGRNNNNKKSNRNQIENILAGFITGSIAAIAHTKKSSDLVYICYVVASISSSTAGLGTEAAAFFPSSPSAASLDRSALTSASLSASCSPSFLPSLCSS